MRGMKFTAGVAFAITVLSFLSLLSSSALSATLTIQEGATENDLISVTSDLSGFSLTDLTAETAAGEGNLILGENSNYPLTPGYWVAGLIEPNVKGIVSDYLLLVVDDLFKDPNNGYAATQHVAFNFVSKDITGGDLKLWAASSGYSLLGFVPESEKMSFLPFDSICYGGDCRTSLEISVYSSPFDAPLPAALPLFVTGLGTLGMLGWRRKRKTQATAA